MQPSTAHIGAFYRAGTLGLAWLDARERNPRGFGPAAEAHWRNYAASPPVLTELDQLELLLRDAASLYPDAFGARAVFDLHHLTPDEPFGNLDVQPAPGLASKLLRPDTEAPADPAALLRQVARAWEMAPVVARAAEGGRRALAPGVQTRAAHAVRGRGRWDCDAAAGRWLRHGDDEPRGGGDAGIDGVWSFRERHDLTGLGRPSGVVIAFTSQ